MGNYKFSLSDILPNALFYKLKNMGKKSRMNHTTQTAPSSSLPASGRVTGGQPQRKSYHFPRDPNGPQAFDPPRKSAKKRRSTHRRSSRTATPRLLPPSSATCSFRPSTESVWTIKPADSTPEDFPNSPLDSTSSSSSSGKDSLLPELVSRPATAPPEKFDGLTVSKIDLPPIITKPVRNSGEKLKKNSGGGGRAKNTACPAHRRISGNSPAGLKLRTNSPRIGHRRMQGRRSVSSGKSGVPESFAVVKSSKDPKRDFRESMVEMIVENNIKGSKELENLLACYLSMNSNEYHDLIIEVFKQIWFDIGNAVRLK
ncbi:unnamed protein product [Cuscuta campestris]|uniref:Transcription repressor n=1 Tax=Cuscuta campestris TaxID=132261 RepID=A0A484L486_9ASTE|nr:unnamed protein product [Cuscuta campestris]